MNNEQLPISDFEAKLGVKSKIKATLSNHNYLIPLPDIEVTDEMMQKMASKLGIEVVK